MIAFGPGARNHKVERRRTVDDEVLHAGSKRSASGSMRTSPYEPYTLPLLVLINTVSGLPRCPNVDHFAILKPLKHARRIAVPDGSREG